MCKWLPSYVCKVFLKILRKEETTFSTSGPRRWFYCITGTQNWTNHQLWIMPIFIICFSSICFYLVRYLTVDAKALMWEPALHIQGTAERPMWRKQWVPEDKITEVAWGHGCAGLGWIPCEMRSTGGETGWWLEEWCGMNYIFKWPLPLLLWEQSWYGEEVVKGCCKEIS